MNSKTIRKAVELADGWMAWSDDSPYFSAPYPFTPTEFIYGTEKGMCQPLLDALAAQLVRQMDAIKFYFVQMDDEGTQVWVEPDFDPIDRIASSYSPDRTMNTINAIIDSKVLE